MTKDEEKALRALARKDGVGTSPSKTIPWGDPGALVWEPGDYYYRDKPRDRRIHVEVSTMGAALVVKHANGATTPVASMTGQFAGPLPVPVDRK